MTDRTFDVFVLVLAAVCVVLAISLYWRTCRYELPVPETVPDTE